MSMVGAAFWQWVAGAVALAVGVVGALLAPAALWQRLSRLGWWLVGLAFLAVAAVIVLLLPRWLGRPRLGQSALPEFFVPGYWQWMLLFVMVAGAAAVLVVHTLRAARRDGAAAADGAGFADIDAAWADILVRLDAAKIDLARQQVVLVLAPEEARAAELVESAGLQVFAQGPAADAPVHAFATADGVLLSCAGACHFGNPGDPEAGERLAHLCDLLRAQDPDRPLVRGVAVVLPIDWAARPESIKESAGLRDDLQVLQRALKVRPPVFALFTGMEGVPGFLGFARRLAAQVSPQMLDQRVGFAVPDTVPFGGDLVQRGLTWQSGWFHTWMLNLLAGDLLNPAGNAELVALDQQMRRMRKRLRSILEAAFSTHRESEPVLFRGCYFVATGADRNERAFSAGLLRGARSRILADHVATAWTDDALREDRRYARLAVAIGVVGGLLTLITWQAIRGFAGPIGYAGPAVIAVVWAVVLLRPRRRA